MAECIPLRNPGDVLPVQATGTLVGKKFVKISGPRLGGGLNGLSTDVVNLPQVVQCSATTDIVLGVSQFDTATGKVGGVFTKGGGFIVPVVAGANITAGQEVQTDAAGAAIPLAAGKAVGLALDSASSGNDCEIKLY